MKSLEKLPFGTGILASVVAMLDEEAGRPKKKEPLNRLMEINVREHVVGYEFSWFALVWCQVPNTVVNGRIMEKQMMVVETIIVLLSLCPCLSNGNQNEANIL